MTIELAHTRRGHGEPVVLLHGIGHRRQAYDPIINRLATKYEVFAVDMPGFGESPALPGGYAAEDVVRTLVENFELWGIEKPHVVGNSLGGLIGLLLGQGGHARSVTGLSPAGFFRPWHLLRAAIVLLSLKLPSYGPNAVLKKTMHTRFGRLYAGWTLFTYPLRHDGERYWGDTLAMKNARAFWPMFFGTLPLSVTAPPELTGPARVPTTIAWGDGDKLLHPRQMEVARQRMSGIECLTLRDCGHVPMSDSPDQVVYAIESTIARAS